MDLRRWGTALSGLLAISLLALPASGVEPGAGAAMVVRGQDLDATAAAVRGVGGQSVRDLPIVSGVAAELTPAASAALRAAGYRVDADLELRFAAAAPADEAGDEGNGEVQVEALAPADDWSLEAGTGVGVALLDTGVADTPDLADRVVRGPDYSDEGDGVDRFGHGTFMAGLIAGNGATDPRFHGVAPGAKIVSLKLAGRDGVTSLSRVLDAIGWVVVNQDEHDIRVMNLSLGVPTRLAPQADPLSAAVQAAWASGITVVVAAGNEGPGTVTSPGRDPWVISVGALDPQGTATVADDLAPDWSGSGRVAGELRPDVAAPGVSTVAPRVPGSWIDDQHPEARLGAYFRGSGTSMAAALTSGAAAVLLEDRPFATPDDVKGALTSTARPVSGAPAPAIDLGAAQAAAPSATWIQRHPIAFRSLDGHLKGNRMPWARPGAPTPTETWARARWADGEWARARWADDAWARARWADRAWARARWADGAWARARWAEATFARARWADAHFMRARWADADWARARWASATWPDAEAWLRAPWTAEHATVPSDR